MSVVYKYPFKSADPLDVPMGPRDQVRLVGVDPSGDPSLPCVWIEHEHPRALGAAALARFRFYGTGHDLTWGAEHVGSVVAGEFVWHVYRGWCLPE